MLSLLFDLFDGLNFAVLKMEDALIAAAAEFQRQIALLLNEGAINQSIKLANKVPDWALFGELLED